jgi:hypothetical protein
MPRAKRAVRHQQQHEASCNVLRSGISSMPSAHPGTVGIVAADQRGHLAALIGEEGKTRPVPAPASSGRHTGLLSRTVSGGGVQAGPGDDHGAGWLLVMSGRAVGGDRRKTAVR